MSLQRKFDAIIDDIERLIECGVSDVPQQLSKENGMNLRLLGDAFQFITDRTLIQYIRQRRLVHALMQKNTFRLSVEQVAEDAGFSDAAAFSKACKNEFGISPSMVTEDVLQKYGPLYFNCIIDSKDYTPVENEMMSGSKKKKVCGVSVKQFSEIKQLLGIGAVYGLSDDALVFVYDLAVRCKVPFEKAAEFYEDYRLQRENGSFGGGQILSEVAELSFKYNLSFSQAQDILYEIECHGFGSLRELPEGFFDIYFSDYNEKIAGYDVPYICEILENLDGCGFSTDKIPVVLEYADLLGVDPIDLIWHYDEYVESYEKLERESFEEFYKAHNADKEA